MPLGQWLSSRMAPAPQAAPNQQTPAQAAPTPQANASAQATESISEIHRRLDGITRQIDLISQRRSPAPTATAPGPSGLANQLNDAISRLDMRLSNLRQAAPPPQAPSAPQAQNTWTPPGNDAVERAASQVYQAPVYQTPAYQPSPPLSPIDAAIAEISARRSSLGGSGTQAAAPNPFIPQAATPPLAPMAAAPVAPPPVTPPPVDLSGIERQLNHLTSQIEALRRPDHLDEAIATFREELAEIRRSLTEALPRKAIDSLEVEIRALGQKIERSRETVGDQEALGSIERALKDIYGAVRSLTPAEQLSGYDTAIQNLSSKIDLLVRANPDSSIVQQLQDAIGALRGIAANVASNDAVGQLSEHIRALGEKVDHLAQSGGNDMLAALEQRIALLTAAMEGRPMPAAADTSHLERAITALSDRIDRLSVASDNSGAVAHVEQRIAYLLERLEGSQAFSQGNFGRIEEALADVLRQLEYQRAALAAPPPPTPAFDPAGLTETIRRELTDVRQAQSSTERLTQDTLEAVHSTLGHVVDRLASIEGDLRRIPAQPEPQPSPPPLAMARAAYPDMSAPLQPPPVETPPPSFRHDDAPLASKWTQGSLRAPINPNLPPDFPIEPGARASGESSDERPGYVPPSPDEGSSQSNFIAAARRAAQAASAATVEKPGRAASLTEAARNAAARATAKVAAAGQSGDKPSRIRSLLVGVSVVVIVLGAFRVTMSLLQDPAPAAAPVEKSNSVLPPTPQPEPKAQGAANPLLIAPNALQQQSFVAPIPPQPAPAAPAARPMDIAATDTTGSLTAPAPAPAPARPVELAAAPTHAAPSAFTPTGSIPDKIPEKLAGPTLRAAAGRGEPAAIYEVAVRYAEGRGVPVNYEEAVKWYERAADKGVVMAMFRLGTMVEKGLGTAKDPDAARRHYVKAAERGNAKAMHNLAVLDADGGGRTPNYKSASVWFKKAAERGVADSQYNLGILYARGIGVEQNLAESFKWFSLAAAQGDADSARKRDDVAKRLDQPSLAAARQAIQNFVPEKQPDEAINVAAPAGGWDPAPITAKRPAAKSAKQASR
jgi:localization factor PodJL